MNETLLAIAARLVLRPQAVIAGVHENVRDGRLSDEGALRFALEGFEDLLGAIRAARFLRPAA
jgi:chromate reductase, NAD(P)H dehydrogenase (quinone)